MDSAGKSTTMSIISGLSDSSGGSVIFEGGKRTPPRGTIGLVPQKDVLFPDLTCIQGLKVWQAVKWSGNSEKREDLMQLLRDCNLEEKAHSNANTMSGGQKRKLQLAVGLVGGSKGNKYLCNAINGISNIVMAVVLVDECTSGVDPLSRRSLWRTLIAIRDSRSVVFTTHVCYCRPLRQQLTRTLVVPRRGGPPCGRNRYPCCSRQAGSTRDSRCSEELLRKRL